MTFTSPLPNVTPGEYVDEVDWNTLVATINRLSNPPSCRVYNSAAISIPTSANTYLTFNTERYDTDSMHSTSVNTGRITFNTAGLYLVTAHVAFGVHATGHRDLYIRANGTTLIAIQNGMTVTTGGSRPILSVATIYKFAATNYVEVGVWQNSGGALNVDSNAEYSPEFAATWIGTG